MKAIKIALEKWKNVAYVEMEQILLRSTETWYEMYNFEDNIGLLILKNNFCKTTTPACEGIFQIWPLGRELWDKILNFEDKIGLT